MRLRKIPGADEKVKTSPFVIAEPENKKGEWKTKIFQNANPIHLEIGTGKGSFLMNHALAEPAVNFLGLEKMSSVLLRAVEKRETMEPIENLYFLCQDAENLAEFFLPGEIDKIYLNFSDPWPKERHYKRRLTYRDYLALYAALLKEDGVIEFKTDNQKLFSFSETEFAESGWTVEAVTRDLYASPYVAGNIPTEYEIRFRTLGNPICFLRARKNANTITKILSHR